jgi:hypothetical protein
MELERLLIRDRKARVWCVDPVIHNLKPCLDPEREARIAGLSATRSMIARGTLSAVSNPCPPVTPLIRTDQCCFNWAHTERASCFWQIDRAAAKAFGVCAQQQNLLL